MSITLGILMSLQIHVGVQPAAAEPMTPEKPDYIVAFSQEHCSPCRRWERIELPKLLAAGIRVRVIMIDEPGQDHWRQRVRLTPTYWICDGATQTCRADDQVTGYTTSAVLVSMMARKSARVADGGKQINRGE